MQDDKATDAGSAAKRSKKKSKSSLEKAAEELNRLLLRMERLQMDTTEVGHQLQTVPAMSGETLIDLLNAASTLEDECNKVLVVRNEDMITKNVTQTDKFCCGSIVVFLEAGSFLKGSFSQAPSLWPLFFWLSRAPRLLRMWRTGPKWLQGGCLSKAISLRMHGVRSAALQHGSASGSAPTGLGEKQAWKDVLVGREVLRGPVAQGDRLGKNADEECTCCLGNATGTEVSDCGCSGKDNIIGCLGDAARDQSTVWSSVVAEEEESNACLGSPHMLQAKPDLLQWSSSQQHCR